MTAPRNPSELCRLETELDELKTELRGYYPKSQKEAILRQIRVIEGILEITPMRYNGGQ